MYDSHNVDTATRVKVSFFQMTVYSFIVALRSSPFRACLRISLGAKEAGCRIYFKSTAEANVLALCRMHEAQRKSTRQNIHFSIPLAAS